METSIGDRIFAVMHQLSRAVPTRATYNRPTGIGRFQSADSRLGDSVGGQILNMFDTESRLTLRRIGRRLWRIGRIYIIPIPTQ